MTQRIGPNGFGFNSTAEDVTQGVSLSGKTMLVTGCNSGIGEETVRVLAMRGAHIIGAARTLDKARAAFNKLGVTGTPLACELSDLASVRAAVAELIERGQKLDAIICNAGIMALPTLTQKDGIELQFYTNHIGHFALVRGLFKRLNNDGRVVIVSSGAHRMASREGVELDNLSGERDYDPWKMYGQSKLANILVARTLSRRFRTGNRVANALHPGVIATGLTRHIHDSAALFKSMDPSNIKTIPQGAATQVYLAAHPNGADTSGCYFSDCNEAKTTPPGRNDELADKLWRWTEDFIAAH